MLRTFANTIFFFSGKAVSSREKGLRRQQPKSPVGSGNSSPSCFEGFCDEECDKKYFVPVLDSEFVLGDIFSSCEILRPRQPRTSKSKAALAWQSIKIKEEPEDDDVKKVAKSPEKPKPKENKPIETQKKTSTKKPPEVTPKPKETPENTQKQAKIPNQKLTNGHTPKKRTPKITAKSSLLKKVLKPEKLTGETGQETSPSIPSVPSAVTKLKMMRRKKSAQKGFRCEVCGRLYKYIRGLRQHKKLECNVEPQFPCPYCPSRFRYRHNIREHVRNYHELAFPKWFAEHYIKPTLEKEKERLRRMNFEHE